MQMLSKNARTVLKRAKKSPSHSVSYADLSKSLNWDLETVKSAGDNLVEENLATEKYSSPLPNSHILWGITLTEHGRHTKMYTTSKLTDFLVKSIVVPIIVAVIAAIITSIITTRITVGFVVQP
jgi:hypothetical protein